MIRTLTFLVFLSFVTSAHADLIYRVRFSQSSLSLDSGQTATLDLWFEEEATNGSAHLLDADGGVNGLVIANTLVLRTGTGDSLVTSVALNPAFDENPMSMSPDANTTPIEQNIFVNSPVFGTDVGSIRR